MNFVPRRDGGDPSCLLPHFTNLKRLWRRRNTEEDMLELQGVLRFFLPGEGARDGHWMIRAVWANSSRNRSNILVSGRKQPTFLRPQFRLQKRAFGIL